MALPPQPMSPGYSFRYTGYDLTAYPEDGRPRSALPRRLQQIKTPFEPGDSVTWHKGAWTYTLRLDARAWDHGLLDQQRSGPAVPGPSAGSGTFTLSTRLRWIPFVRRPSRTVHLMG